MMNAGTLIDTQSQLWIVGVEVGSAQIRAQILQNTTARYGPIARAVEDLTPGHIISRISSVVQDALGEAGTSLDKIAAISIGIPAPVNFHEGEVYRSPNLPGWDRVPLRGLLKEELEKKFKIGIPPILVDNDANVAALGEHMFGAGKGCSDMVYVTISTGVGAGVIVDGKLLRGVSGTAAELGHMTIYGSGSHCKCGNIGCLESIASGRAIVAHARAVARVNAGNGLLGFIRSGQEDQDEGDKGLPILESIQAVAQAADKDKQVKAIIDDAARALGLALVNIIHIFNPRKIILGGSVVQILGLSFLDPAEEFARVHAMKVPSEAVEIVQGQLGGRVGLVGAEALAISWIKDSAK